ncbi:MAG TPA: MFS transporter, partial [Polyangiaceae bacterium]|nr:MFS transporter [Polyangiaceae bacterium]
MEAQVDRRPYAEGAEQKAVLTGLLVGVLVVGIDSTIVATILPRMLSEFGDLPLAPWVFASYMLMQISSAPILGKLSDRFGRKRVLLFGLFTFLLGSELIAFSRSFGELILFRGLQGIGAGAILPAALATLFLDFPPEMRPRLQGNFSAVYGVSNILGPLLGAVLAEHVGWRYAFHINIVFVSISAYCISRSLRDTRGSHRKGQLDWA